MQLSSCLPEIENTRVQSVFLRNSVLTKIHKYLVKHPSLPSNLEGILRKKWKGVEINPALVSLSLKLEDKPEPQSVLETLKYSKRPGKPEILGKDCPKWVNSILAHHNSSLSPQDSDLRVSPFTGEHEQKVMDAYERAFTQLEKIWPEAWHTVTTFIHHLILVDGTDFIANSQPHYHGAVMVNPDPSWSDLHYLENLVHEAAHLELNIRRMKDPYLYNSTDIVFSAIRKSQRPMLGVLHAAFVLVRVNMLLSKIHKLKPHQFPLLAEFRQKYSDLLQSSVETLEKHGDFTEAGCALFTQMKNEQESMTSYARN